MVKEDRLACVKSVSSRVTELEREQKKWKIERVDKEGGGGGGGVGYACPQTPRF